MTQLKFEFLADDFIQQINEGKLEVNDKLPSENELCKKYKVSRTTVRNALSYLEKEGYIIKRQGKGSFVASPILVQKLSKTYSFAESIKKKGKEISTIVTFFEINYVTDPAILDALEASKKDEFYIFERFRIIENQPYLYEITYVPFSRVGVLTKGMLENSSFYKILDEKFNIQIDRAQEEFRAINSFKKISRYLDLDDDGAVLEIRRTAYTNSVPIEYTISFARGDKYRYIVNMEKGEVK